jgi:hypothetical protein
MVGGRGGWRAVGYRLKLSAVDSYSVRAVAPRSQRPAVGLTHAMMVLGLGVLGPGQNTNGRAHRRRPPLASRQPAAGSQEHARSSGQQPIAFADRQPPANRRGHRPSPTATLRLFSRPPSRTEFGPERISHAGEHVVRPHRPQKDLIESGVPKIALVPAARATAQSDQRCPVKRGIGAKMASRGRVASSRQIDRPNDHARHEAVCSGDRRPTRARCCNLDPGTRDRLSKNGTRVSVVIGQ